VESITEWIDFHCHSKHESKDLFVEEIVSCHPGKNTTDGLYTIGYHPWWSSGVLTSDQLNLIKNHYLHEDRCIALGECGLDKLQGGDSSVQIKNFELQVDIANQLKAPVIVHCVRKYDALLSIYRDMARTRWVIHGFKRNALLAKTILDLGISLSVAPYHHMNTSFTETLEMIPLNQLFLETDSDRRISIMERYNIMSSVRKIPTEVLKLQLIENCKILFDTKWR
jgi:TatD DNase family protein